MSKLRNLGGSGAEPGPEGKEPARVRQKDGSALDMNWSHNAAAGVPIERIEVDAVVGGALMRITFGATTDPGGVLAYLKSLDPNCKVRDDFPMKGGGFGKRETKRARLLVCTLRATDNGLFIDLICKGESDVSVRVSKKKSAEFRDLIVGTGKLDDDHVSEIDEAIANKKQATVVIRGHEGIEVEYWTGDDGSSFLESLHGVAAATKTSEEANGNSN